GLGPVTQAPKFQPYAFVMADGYRLPVSITLPNDQAPKAVLVALHGFNDYSHAFADAAPIWAQAGIAVYAYDQRGFGATQGRGLWHGTEAMVSDLANVTYILRSRYPSVPIAVLGESMGGAVALTAVTSDDLPHPDVDRTILSAPAVWGRAVMPWWQRWPLTLFSYTLPWLEIAPHIRRTPSDNIPMLRALARDPLMIRRTRIDAIHGLVDLMDNAYAGIPKLGDNVLLLYGLNEDILPDSAWQGGVSRLTPGAGWRLALYDTGYHMLIRDLNAKLVIDDIASFILHPAAPLPSGRESNGLDLPRAVN
ncbi:MAG: alpha/beta fold hydrolase, partial [Alphaproteobacteria bacterium]|nr:alpha/beta fold hydrolase [Alphaproteobacteria bacterium]